MTIKPDADMMLAFLEHLFGDMLDGWVELAWTDPWDKNVRHGRSFDVGSLEELVDEAVKQNAIEGQNTYFGAALRAPNTAPFGRGNDDDFYKAPAFWADLDEASSVAEAKAHYNGAPPTIGVITGRTPHPRVQLWWKQEEPCTDADVVRMQNKAIAAALAGDPVVINPSRVMRLAGTVAWPVKEGRVAEVVELQTFDDDRPRVYLDGQVATAYPPIHTNGNASEKATGLNLGLVTIDPVAMLREAEPGNWHNPMLAFTAHCVAAGYPDWIIVEAARQVLDDPNNPSDLESLIEGARRKFDKPDSGEIEAGPLNVVGLSSFINMKLPERKTLLSPWLPEQGLVMVYAERGIGKTYFALNVAHAVATGGSYLNWQANERHRVLYLDGEMPAPTMQERSRAIAGFNPPENLNDWFRLMTPDLQDAAMPDLSTKEGQARIEAQLAGVELVVIDNLSTLCRSGIENEAESWLPVQEWLLGLRRRGMSAMIVHHAGKGGLQRGTSRREDVLDTTIAMRRPKDYEPSEGCRFEVHFEKSRGFTGDDAQPIEALLSTNTLGAVSWTVTLLGDKLSEEIAELVAQGMSEREIARELDISRSKVTRCKRKLA